MFLNIHKHRIVLYGIRLLLVMGLSWSVLLAQAQDTGQVDPTPEATAPLAAPSESPPVLLPTEEVSPTDPGPTEVVPTQDITPVEATATVPDVIVIPTEALTSTVTDAVTSNSVQALNVEAQQAVVPQMTVSLAAPVPNIPADNAIVRTPRPTFSWQVVPGTNKYDLQVDDSEAFDSPLALNSTNLSAPLFTPSINLAQGHYVRRVIAKDNGGHVSAPSTVMHLIINPAFLPAPGSSIVSAGATANVVFTWTGAIGSNTYTVQLDEASQADFATPLALTCTTSGQSCTISMPLGAYVWRVLRAGEVPVGTPVSNAFTVSPAAPPPPQVVSPFNGKYLTPSERPVVPLSWKWAGASTPAGGPFTYEVQVFSSTNVNGTPVATTTSNTQNATVYFITDGTYYWRVRAINQFGVTGNWSGTSSFIIDNVPPADPTTLAPTGEISTARPTFKWTAVPGAYRYRIRAMAGGYSCSSQDGVLTYLSTAMITGTSYTIPESEPAFKQDDYEVCVQAFDRSENFSNEGANWTKFRIFLGKSPANGAVLPANKKPKFEWSPTANTASVTLKIASNPNFQTLVYTTTLPGWSTNFTLPNVLPTGTYYWRVERAGEVITNPAIVRQFFVGQVTLPPGPIITSPTSGELVGRMVFMGWTAPVLLPGATMTDYQLDLSTSPTFATLVFPTFYGDPDATYYTYEPPLNQDHVTYYWRVRSITGSTPVTEWSTSSFVVDTLPPGKPHITSPANQATVSTTRPVITWTAVPGATGYDVGWTDLYGTTYSTQVTGTSYTPSVNMPQTWIDFGVAALDGVNTGPQDGITFLVRLGSTPVNGANVLTTQPTFTWVMVPDATGYTLQIDDDPLYDGEDSDGDVLRTINVGNVTSYTLTADQALAPNQGYYWRLAPSAFNGGYPSLNNTNFFTVNVTFAAPTNLVSKNGAGVETTTFSAVEDVILEWSPVSPTPPVYEFQASTNSSFAAPYEVITSINNTQYLFFSDEIMSGVNYWRVRALYGAGGSTPGPWSEVKSFTFGG